MAQLYRVFDGKKYKLRATYESKAQAQKRAPKGVLHYRIVKEPKGGYSVYVRAAINT